MHQKRLGDIASYINGYPFKPEQRGKVGIPIIRIQDLTGNAYDLGFYDGDYPKKVEINDGDVLISWSASLGVYEWNHGKALLNQHIFRVVFDKLTVDKEFFMYAVQYKLEEMESKAHGATMKHITKKDFDNTVIPFPTIVEQERISNTLNKLHTIIDSKKFQLEKLDNLIKARFVEMFGENDATSKVLIGDAVELINGRAFKPTDWTPTGLPIIRIQNLNDTKAPYNYFYGAYDKKNYIKSGELLFSWSGTPGTSFGAFIWNRGPGLLNQHIFRVLPKKDYDLNFLRFALNAQLDEIISKAHGGVGLQHITKSELEKIAIPYPNRKLQAAFSAFVAQIDKSKFALSNELAMGNFYIRLIHDCIMHGCIDL